MLMGVGIRNPETVSLFTDIAQYTLSPLAGQFNILYFSK